MIVAKNMVVTCFNFVMEDESLALTSSYSRAFSAVTLYGNPHATPGNEKKKNYLSIYLLASVL